MWSIRTLVRLPRHLIELVVRQEVTPPRYMYHGVEVRVRRYFFTWSMNCGRIKARNEVSLSYLGRPDKRPRLLDESALRRSPVNQPPYQLFVPHVTVLLSRSCLATLGQTLTPFPCPIRHAIF